MRVIRMIFLVLLAIVLVLVALANRQAVVLRLLPGNLDAYLGGRWQVTVPLFLIIFTALLVGMILGLIWEWMREAQLRGESARRARDLAVLERQAGRNTVRQDEVLALLDHAPPPAATTPPARTAPARTLLPGRR